MTTIGQWVLLTVCVGSLVASGWLLWWVKAEIEQLRDSLSFIADRNSINSKKHRENAKDISEVEFRVGTLEDSLQGSIGEIWSTALDTTGVEMLQEQVNKLESNVYDKSVMANLWEQTENKKEYTAKQKRKEAVLSELREESPVHSVNKAEY